MTSETDHAQPTTRLRTYWDAAKSSVSLIAENDISLISAGVAFFAMLSLFPALAALIALLGLISDPVVVIAEMEEMRGLLPDEVFDLINDQVVSLVSARAETLGWAGVLSLLVAVWSARAGVGALIIGLNNVYQRRNRPAAHHYLRAISLTLTLVAVGIIAMLSLVVAPLLLAFFPLGPIYGWLVEVVRYFVAVVVLFVGLAVLYRFGPNRRLARIKWVTIGAVVAIFSWALMSFAFAFYVANFGNYNQIYGSIGAVIAMLIWLWLSSFLILFGGLLNAQVELRRNEGFVVSPESEIRKKGTES